MTTRDKGITLPTWGYLRLVNGYFEVSTSVDFSSNASYRYTGLGVFPVIQTAPVAGNPQTLSLQAQDATPSYAANGGDVKLTPGVGSVGNSSGNAVVKDSAGNGGSWNTSHLQLGNYHLWLDAVGHARIKSNAPTTDLDGIALIAADLIGSATYDPPSLAAGIGTTTTVAVVGAALGDFCSASFSLDTQGVVLYAWVSAVNTVSVRFQNVTAGVLDLASGTLRVRVSKQ